jgi:hypothetical protein
VVLFSFDGVEGSEKIIGAVCAGFVHSRFVRAQPVWNKPSSGSHLLSDISQMDFIQATTTLG